MSVESKRVIAEAGMGGLPIYDYSKRVDGELKSGSALYIGIEINPDKIFKLRQGYFGYNFVGDVYDLPLRDNSLDEAWLINVFGEFNTFYPSVYNPVVFPNSKVYIPGSTTFIFKGLARATKLGGSIYIGDFYSVPARWVTQLDFEQFGLVSEVYTGERISEFVTVHQISYVVANQAERERDSYFLALRKQK